MEKPPLKQGRAISAANYLSNNEPTHKPPPSTQGPGGLQVARLLPLPKNAIIEKKKEEKKGERKTKTDNCNHHRLLFSSLDTPHGDVLLIRRRLGKQNQESKD